MLQSFFHAHSNWAWNLIIMLINVKMPTFVGILTFNSMIITTSASFTAKTFLYFQHFNNWAAKICMKKVLNPWGPKSRVLESFWLLKNPSYRTNMIGISGLHLVFFCATFSCGMAFFWYSSLICINSALPSVSSREVGNSQKGVRQ